MLPNSVLHVNRLELPEPLPDLSPKVIKFGDLLKVLQFRTQLRRMLRRL